MFKLKAVGADPEFFLCDQNNNPVTAIGKIGGTKDKPLHINADGFSAIQEDNVMVEFNIKPARTPDEFVDNVMSVYNYLNIKCQMMALRPLVVPHVVFSDEALDHPQAQTMGCLADFNAWTFRANAPISPVELGNYRVAGGHVHISFTWQNFTPTRDEQGKVVRMLDLALGVPAVVLDTDDVRRKFYGRAGCHRPRTYGVEYRTLSNFWIKERESIEWVFNQVLWAFNKLNKTPTLDGKTESGIQYAINENDIPTAKEIIAAHNIPMPSTYVA